MRPLFLTKTKKELYREAVKRGFHLMPVQSARDIVEDEQLAARHFWLKVDYPEWSVKLRHPGPAVRVRPWPSHVPHRAPNLGEHNFQVYCEELGLSQEELHDLKREGIL